MALRIKPKTAPEPSARVLPRFHAGLRSDGVLEVLIYSDIVSSSVLANLEAWGYPTDDMISAGKVKSAIDAAGTFGKICVRVNSPGGDAFEGMATYNILRSAGKPVEVYIDGIAASAASIIAMAGDTITMGVNSMIMIHNAWSDCQGFASDMREMANVLDKVSEAIGATYVKKTGKSSDEIKALMDTGTWLSAKDCMDLGFCTAISETPADDGMKALAKQFRNRVGAPRTPVPEFHSDSSGTCACDCMNCMVGACMNCYNEDCKDPNCEDCPMQEGTGNSTPVRPGAAEKKTKRVDGEDLTWDCFIVALDHQDIGTWHLPWKFSTEEKTKSHLRNAVARFNQVEGLTQEQKDAAWKKLVRLCKKYGIEVDEGKKDAVTGPVTASEPPLPSNLSLVEAELWVLEHRGQ